MTRIFLDANVLFSAAYGSPGLQTLWDLARAGSHDVLASPHVIEEARRNLEVRHQPSLQRLLDGLTVVQAPAPDLPCPIELPAGDREAFLAALAAGASHFLTGDVRHFGRDSGRHFGRRIAGVLIQSPADYLAARRRRRR